MKIILIFVKLPNKYCCNSKKKVGGDMTASKSIRESMKLARTLFIIFVVFACCWAPYAVVIIGKLLCYFPSVE